MTLALPVRLFSENPNGLVSLLDMLRFNAHNFVAAFGTLGQAMMEIRSGRTMPSNRTLGAVGASLGELPEAVRTVGVGVIRMHLKRLAESDDLQQLPTLLKGMEESQQRIWDELSNRVYVQIYSDKAKYYEPTSPPFGHQFSTAIDDVEEAVIVSRSNGTLRLYSI